MALELFIHDEARRPSLVTSRCRTCGWASFPARRICARCGAEEVARVEGGRRGRVLSSAVVHHAPIGFQAPYLVGLVELAEGPVVFCPLLGWEPVEGAVPAGAAVELAVAPARPGGAAVVQYRRAHPDSPSKEGA